MIRQRSFLIRNRKRLALLAVLGALVLALAVEHTGVGHGEMEGGDMGGVVTMCLAVVQAAALLVGAAALLKARPRRAIPPRELFAVPAIAMPTPVLGSPLSRAGPSLLQVFLR